MRDERLPRHWTWAGLRAWSALWRDLAGVDQLDAALRGLAIGIVLALSLADYRFDTPAVALPFPVRPAVVAVGLVVYNLAVIGLLGVPWRRRPGFALYLLDWLMVTTAILLTGGFYSPFLVLYYALVIGAALRLDVQRTGVLVGACALAYAALSRDAAGGITALRLPWLVVAVTSLLMAALTTIAMRRAVLIERTRLHLEHETAQRLALLNDLTRTVLNASPDSGALLRTVAAIAPSVLQADCAVAALLNRDGRPGPVAADQGRAPDLSPGVLALIQAAAAGRAPLVIGDVPADPRGPDLRACLGRVQTAVCAPLFVDAEPAGALIVGSYSPRSFTAAELSLLAAVGDQIGLSVRLARLYDRERHKAALSAERERLERDLLNMVSHELRTPLTAIKTGVSALLAGESARPSAETRLLQNVDRSTQRLILLVNDLLDMARLRAGRATLVPEDLDLIAVILDAVAVVRPLAEARQQALALHLPEGLSVPGDRRRLEQILLNLLNNAIKYTPPGGALVVGAAPEAGQVRVWVQDSGPGIPPDEQPRIFDWFYTAPGPGSPRPDGAGLGLAIARSLVALHGGQIGVESAPGGGSRFYFTLPAPA